MKAPVEKSIAAALGTKKMLNQVSSQIAHLLVSIETDPTWKWAKPLTGEIIEARAAMETSMAAFGRSVVTMETKDWRKGLNDNQLIAEVESFTAAMEHKIATARVEANTLLAMHRSRANAKA